MKQGRNIERPQHFGTYSQLDGLQLSQIGVDTSNDFFYAECRWAGREVFVAVINAQHPLCASFFPLRLWFRFSTSPMSQ